MHQITWFWPPKSKNFPTVGGRTPPLPHPPPARSLRSLAFVLKIFCVFFLKSEITPPPHTHTHTHTHTHLKTCLYVTDKEHVPPCSTILTFYVTESVLQITIHISNEWDSLGFCYSCEISFWVKTWGNYYLTIEAICHIRKYSNYIIFPETWYSNSIIFPETWYWNWRFHT